MTTKITRNPKFTTQDIPNSGQAAYNASDKGRARRKRYRHDNSKWQTDAVYLRREFVAWDGEGITTDDGQHLYVMLANSKGGYIANPNGLSTFECLSFITSEAVKYSNAIHIIYGGGYDFNCWLCDLSERALREAYNLRSFSVGIYRIQWRRGKSFTIGVLDTSVTIYDTVSFFQCAFVKACDDYLGTAFVERELIVENKALRSSFTWADVEQVKRYNELELVNLVLLMNELRSRLNKVGLRPRRWDGPGAIASALMSRENVKDAKAECPSPVARASRFAYAGGRFEVVRYGHVEKPAFEYDVNSAYPSALRNVPNLAAGTWVHHSGDVGDRPFAVYRLRYSDGPATIPGPLFSRSANGTICYPRSVEGWYWSPECEAARMYVESVGGTLEVMEVWEYVEANDQDRPFSFIDGLYLKRQALKRANDGAHVGIKLGLNSLYGKLAQQVGWQPARGTTALRIPPFHQLEWAGYVTSHCRATVLRAALLDPSSVIAFETDALFTSAPLPLDIGNGLGQFEYTEFTDLTYVQSGLYFGNTIDGKRIDKTRGVDRGSLNRADVLTGLQQVNGSDRFVDSQLTRFVGAGIALTQSFDRWRTWETSPKRIHLEPQGKRAHYECPECDASQPGTTLGVWHETMCPFVREQVSCEFPIEWINPNPAMTMLSELREGDDATSYGVA